MNIIIDSILQNSFKNVSLLCREQMTSFWQGLQGANPWALKMLDASSKLQSGVLEGNIADFGSFEECLAVDEITDAGRVQGKYCLVSWEPWSSSGSVLAEIQEEYGYAIEFLSGLCIPRTCGITDLMEMLGSIPMTRFTVQEDNCQETRKPPLDLGAIFTIILLSIISALVLFSTCYDVYIKKQEKKPTHKILLAFSLYTNGKRLFSTTKEPNIFSSLHGLKSLSMLWILLAHGFMGPIGIPLSNYLEGLDIINSPSSMGMLSANLAVDTFFLLSGMLVCYFLMQKLGNGGTLNVPMFYLHRYLRLTPAVAMVVLFHATLFRYLGSGPVFPYINESLVMGCKEYWWSALLYVQNFVNPENMCVPQSWYLSVDMQLHLLSPIVLIPLIRWPKWAISFIVALILFSVGASFFSIFHYELPPTILGFVDERNTNKLMKYYYYVTYTRMGSYLIGILLGYFIYRAKSDHKCNFNKLLNSSVWVVTIAILGLCVFGFHNTLVVDTHNNLANAFYNALVRPTWALGISWIVYSCAFGRAGPIRSFLSSSVFQVLSKLSYSMYLVHYGIIFLKYASIRYPLHYNVVDQLDRFWAFLCWSFIAAIVLTLTCESPVIAMEKCFRKKGGVRSSPEQQSRAV